MAAAPEGTRQQILHIMQRRGPLTVDQLTQHLGLAAATIRRHLDILQRDLLVSFQQARKKQGRPEYVYSLTEAGQESGYRDYPKLLCLLLSNLRAFDSCHRDWDESHQLLPLLLLQVSEQLSRPYSAGLPDSADLESRTSTLQHALTDIGFSPEIDLGDNQVGIRLCNCPFRAAALWDESVCLIDSRLIQDFLGAEPVRQSTIRDGARTCSYTVIRSG